MKTCFLLFKDYIWIWFNYLSVNNTRLNTQSSASLCRDTGKCA